MKNNRLKQCVFYGTVIPLSLSMLAACSSNGSSQPKNTGNSANLVPADKFDLSQWKITLPMDQDSNGKIDEIDVEEIQTYAHPDYFYLDEQGGMVFTSPNKAITTATSSNTRSELRQMIRGTNIKIKTKNSRNNFALAAHPLSERFGSVGGKMEATLKVDHVAVRAGHADKPPAYSVVVGQIHAGKDKALIEKDFGFGWGNEPIKIYYKKWPNHETGSVFWNYERNLPKDDPNRTDITYPVWGNTWENSDAPGSAGIALGEEFSYEINVYQSTMHLTFTAPGKPTVEYSIDLSNNVDANGKVDKYDHPLGYLADWHYFKAGAYNQCSTKDSPGGWYTACPGTGDWKTDKANGDYTQVTFSKLVLSEATPVN
ncbi:polysaccharide lyase family 7 protein [Pseudoalteromonas sp. A601]|uniref:polysaccharide lyase family 7 protein n=1 Tax=Pseudoalteromonas sp. A601 TaxID=1967839 RepID=UPI000B566B7E|nr:polysaccharide lyase family 7 protein [Pseudoalteromonas sp. A601]OUS69836.1 polysaccharide lyase family 7 protein [Pseudoalteromonas sp. A601]